MPRASRSPRLTFDSLADVAAALRKDGGRFSAPRRTVLEALFAADGPVSAEHIARDTDRRPGRPDLSTVYRILERLEELGVVRHVHIGHGPGLYALARSGEREYLVCEGCHEVTTVDAGRLDSARDEIRKASGYQARFSHFAIVGQCPRCTSVTDRGPDHMAGAGEMTRNEKHSHDKPHTHEHTHGSIRHAHPHTEHEHAHLEHEHEHSHGDRVHSHRHIHEDGLIDQRRHDH